MAAIFVQTGEYHFVDMLATATNPWYIGWGSGTTTEVPGDVDLEAAATETRVTATSEGEVATASDAMQWVGIITASATRDISEAGLFQHATSTATGLWIRGTHTAVSAAESDQIEYTFTLTLVTCT